MGFEIVRGSLIQRKGEGGRDCRYLAKSASLRAMFSSVSKTAWVSYPNETPNAHFFFLMVSCGYYCDELCLGSWEGERGKGFGT